MLPRNPLTATWSFLRGDDFKVRLPEPPTEAPGAQKALPVFWPGVPPQPGPGMLQRFLPGSPATWVPGADAAGANLANSAVFACLNVIATAFPEAPLKVFRRQPAGAAGAPKALPDHPLQALLERPNPYHSPTELWYWTQLAKHVAGNAYWEKVRTSGGPGGNVVELWPLSPARVEPITTPADRRAGVFISFYRYETEPGRTREIAPQDMVHFRLGLEDCDHRLGCSPLQRLVREVASDDEATRFTLALLGNFAVPGLIVTTPDRTMSREDAERIKEDVGSRFSGDNRGRVGVLNNGATVSQFGFSPEQLSLQVLHQVPEERISGVLGVPAIMAGLGAGLSRATYSNFHEAREMFTESKLCPLWNDDAGSINLQLLPEFDTNRRTFTRFDLTDVRALQEDEDKKYARLDLGVQHKWITVNEARQDVGLPPVDGGDELTAPVPPQLQGALAGHAGNGQDGAQEGQGPPSNLPDAQAQQRRLPPPAQGQTAALSGLEQKAIGLQLFPALMDAMVSLAMPGFQRDLDQFFLEQRQRIMDAVIREG